MQERERVCGRPKASKHLQLAVKKDGEESRKNGRDTKPELTSKELQDLRKLATG